MNDIEAVDWHYLRADSLARQGFFKALQAESEEAYRQGTPFPVVPPNDELAFVDGFLLWKGRPVWYSGEGRGTAAASMERPGFVETTLLAGPGAAPPANARPSLRRRLRRRWRALAYGHAI